MLCLTLGEYRETIWRAEFESLNIIRREERKKDKEKEKGRREEVREKEEKLLKFKLTTFFSNYFIK
jgi:hypothetical protein